MEDNNEMLIEDEEIAESAEVEEASANGRTGSLGLGIVGGFLAYAVIGGAKKLWTLLEARWAAKKAKETVMLQAADSESVQVKSEQPDSREEVPEK